MELVNDFVVNSPIAETWATLTDVEKIAPCLPGAQLEEIEGDTFRGVVKVKVGPIVANFKGEAQFTEKDDVQHRAVLNAAGRDTGNKGNASAVITAQLESLGERTTKCTVSTDLKITGKFAQFGRGAMQDISSKLLGEFVANLESLTANESTAGMTDTPGAIPVAADLPHDEPPSTAEPGPADSNGASPGPAGIRKIVSKPAAPLDLGSVAGGAILKRLLPVLGGVVALYVLLRLLRRGRDR